MPRAQTPPSWLVARTVSNRLDSERAGLFPWDNIPKARPVITLVDSGPRGRAVALRPMSVPRAQTPSVRLASVIVTIRFDSVSSWYYPGGTDPLEYPVAWPM